MVAAGAGRGRRRALAHVLHALRALTRALALLLVLAPLLATVGAPWAGAAALAKASAPDGVLRIAVEGTYPPFNFKDPQSGYLTGYDVDIARDLAARLKRKPQFVLIEWNAILPALRAGRVDVAISQVIITPEREKAFDFSAPYMVSHSQLMVRRNERAAYASLNDLKGRKLGLRQGSVFEQRARAVSGIEVKSYPAMPESLQDLAFGRIDALLDDSLLVSYLIKHTQLPLKAGARVGSIGRVGIAMRKGRPQLKRQVDKALHDARADGTLRRLSHKWFGFDASSMVGPESKANPKPPT